MMGMRILSARAAIIYSQVVSFFLKSSAAQGMAKSHRWAIHAVGLFSKGDTCGEISQLTGPIGVIRFDRRMNECWPECFVVVCLFCLS